MNIKDNDEDFLLKSLYANCTSIIRLNTITGEFHFITSNFPSFHKIDTSNFDEYMSVLIKMKFLHPYDMENNKKYFSVKAIRKICQKQQNGEYLKFRRVDNGKLIWMSSSIFIPPEYSDENPDALLLTRQLSQKESDYYESIFLINKNIHKIIKYNITTNNSELIKINNSERYLVEKFKNLSVKQVQKYILEGIIHPDDAEIVKKYANNEFLKDYFKSNNNIFSYYYRRKIGNIYIWVNQNIIPTSNYTPDNQEVMLYIEDTNEIVHKYFNQKALYKYESLRAKNPNIIQESFYENLIPALDFLTSSYNHFLLINLNNDIFVKYKYDQNVFSKEPVGYYSESFKFFLENTRNEDLINKFHPFDTCEKIREQLMDKQTISFTVKQTDGKFVKIIYTKFATENGVPSKVLFYGIILPQENLLKIKTFGNFEVFDSTGNIINFKKQLSKEVLAYLVDKRGYSVTTKDLIQDILGKQMDDINGAKYISKLLCSAIKDLEKAGYKNIIIREKQYIYINEQSVDCDYYHLLDGDISYWQYYHNEYMKEYSWAEDTNASILHFFDN